MAASPRTHDPSHEDDPAPEPRPLSTEQVPDRMSENSPLLSNDGDEHAAPRPVDETQTTKSLWYMAMLTLSIGGLQIAWSVELSNGSPYLLSLGLSKSLMALVWIAGPLTGTLVVPYVGILSDNSRLPWGKRRPFMVGGTVATVAALLFLAWVKDIVAGILAVFGADPASEGVRVAVVVAAVLGIYILDIAINTELANSMASRFTGVGNIIGYMAGYANLPAHLWFLGNTQFKILCAIASVALALTVALSTSIVHERDPRTDGLRTRRVCQVQFCAWVGFFPLLFYTSSYIGEIYIQPYLRANPNMTPEELDALYEQATRIGTFALLVNAVVSLSTNVFLPFFIAPTFDSRPVAAKGRQEAPRSLLGLLRIPGFSLKRAWLGSLVLFAGAMFCTPFVRSVEAATVLIGVAGITWAMALWAPWAIISAEISRRDALDRARKLEANMAPRPTNQAAASGESSWSPGSGSGSDEQESPADTDQAGVILGIHNMAIALPQIIATVGSSIIFKIWQKPRGTPGDHSIATVMALGGVCVLASVVFAARIKDDASAAVGEAADEERGGAVRRS
ncbi:MFS/sugar transport protein [Hirsutella rhossiliensis]|uniref:MFS/sugar transport protein n=1 Tax=Hirsutella rhossiliensis TaxID=111463 RepID=A0A9P8SHS9_9HYPO|nr:MFS/sugar transport protein [Hirsutella rhossiliensis]KAH0963106.1 MFS/sugar transport protein [Hirsutella rhossiliensis]